MALIEFQTERTRIISEMLDNPDEHGIYPTTKCFEELDKLFENLQLPSKQDYEEVLKGHRELVRELDVLINGKNAAKQASLCDIVSQLKNIPTQRLWVEKSVQEVPQIGAVNAITKDGVITPFYYTGTTMSLINFREQYTHYLVPVEPPQNNNDKK